eukprot:TRINITY_DN10063_c0_g1_i1.p1 TRINITY_DN10063_c0_g1~~TRINITY_DN10063_c0_g1_i1.p1  ORF type:complete len:796 (-),score=182.47 TRINITY_DN10063_c0_g1_i1:98-2200(-)
MNAAMALPHSAPGHPLPTSSTTSFVVSLKSAVHALLTNYAALPSVSLHVICLIPYQQNVTDGIYTDVDGSMVDLGELVSQVASNVLKKNRMVASLTGKNNGAAPPRIDLQVLRIQPALNAFSDASVPVQVAPPRQFTHLAMHTTMVHPSRLLQVCTDLSLIYYDLECIRVSGIPMKESAQGSARAVYDVLLLHERGAGSVHVTRATEDEYASLFSKIGGGSLDNARTRQVKWKSSSRRTSPDTLPCSCMHRVTPSDHTTAPAQCLMRHICSGKPVFLVSNAPGHHQDTEANLTHALLLQGAEVYMHCLQPASLSADDTGMEGTLEFYKQPVDPLPAKEFAEIMDRNALMPRTTQGQAPWVTIKDHGKEIVCSRHMERYTRVFSSVSKNSILNSPDQGEDMRRILGIFKETLLSEVLGEGHLRTLTDIVNRVGQYAQHVDPKWTSTFPKPTPPGQPPTLGANPMDSQQRREFYCTLWTEMFEFAALCSTTPNHARIIPAMERAWPDMSSVSPRLRSAPKDTKPTPSSAKPAAKDGKKRKIKEEQEASAPTVDGDMWAQYEACRQMLEAEDLRAERERQMAATTPQVKQERPGTDPLEASSSSSSSSSKPLPSDLSSSDQVASAPRDEGTERDRKRKVPDSLGQETTKAASRTPADDASLFSQFWRQVHKKQDAQAVEFRGRVEPGFHLYAKQPAKTQKQHT